MSKIGVKRINPFVFNNRVKAVIVSYKISKSFEQLLTDLNIDIIKTLPIEEIDEPVKDHPDMAVHPIDNNKFVVYNKHKDYYEEKLKEYGIKVIPSSNALNKFYPNDVALNVSRTNDYYFYKNSCIDLSIENYLKETSKPKLVKQGYSKCSSLIIGKDTVVTSDKGLYKSYLDTGIKSYLIPFGAILLSGYDTGFIGGCGGMISEDEILFYGNLERYKYSDQLVEILNTENIKYYYPRDCEFVDLGSIIGIRGGIND
ncbi:DUF6873 family GME fold protein [Lagierella sp. ICN-221743]